MDSLINEQILIGGAPGKPANDSIRVLAYTMLAEVLYQVRFELNFAQLTSVVNLSARVIHDHNIPFNIQSTLVKLLMNVVDSVAKSRERTPGTPPVSQVGLGGF